MAPPLFIVGTSRSGTSWAFDLCASHPDMSMGYESKIPVEGIEVFRQHKDTMATKPGVVDFLQDLNDQVGDPINPAIQELLTKPETADRIYSALDEPPTWSKVCEALFCSIEDTSHWGNKLLRVEMTPTLAEHWPDAKFLVLTRDPRGVVASQSKKFDHGIDYSAMYWNTHSQFVLDRIGLPGAYKVPNHMVVDLVEMAKDPRPALEWAFSELGLSTDPVEELIERFPGDPERLDKWRNSLDKDKQRRMEEYCYTAMSALGYQPELATGPKNLGAVRKVSAMAREHGKELIRDPGSIKRKQIGKRVKSALGWG